MTEIGEGIGVTRIRLEKGKCVFCGKDTHERPKRDVIKPTGWTRKEISGVGGRFAGKKLGIYPDSTSPPVKYRAEGHHCLAFSSFITGAQAKPPDP